MTNTKTKVLLFGICALTLFFHLCFRISHFAFAQDKIIAIVNNEVITQKDLNDFLNFMRIQLAQEYSGKELETKIQSMKLDLLNKLIEDRLILQEAKREKIKIDENRVKARLEEIKKRYPSEEDFRTALSKQGLVEADIEARIREQFLMYNIINTKIKSKIKISPQEVTDFYQNNTSEFILPEERELEIVNITDKEMVEKIKDDIKSGLNFTDLVNKYSLKVDKLTVFKNGQLKEEIEEILFKLKPDQITDVIQVENTYYIFKLDKIIPSRQQTFSEAQDEIYNFLYNQKMQQELKNWLDEIKKRSYIKIFTD